ARVAPELVVRAVPALEPVGFLEASFKQTDDAPLLPGRVAIYRDGIFVGRAVMPLTPKDETVRLGFGADEKVKVARVVVRKSAGSAGIIITSAKTDEREFKITVRNGHDSVLGVVIEDRIPVSENADVQVELLATSTPPTERDVRDQRGVVAWRFDAKPGEARDIKLAWRVRWPIDKTVEYQPRLP
ncbi:MAG: mucoidy inhibitor MuiA family protein, partial [Proteobacteria bacterium]|nr:mucoidy inhibitor MuiA family protein [Pseudomonadota bacterium]